jgi:mono/diheme cytochrome c family protein
MAAAGARVVSPRAAPLLLAQGRGSGPVLSAAVSRSVLLALACVLVAVLLAGCGGEISVPEDQQTNRRGAELFNERCSGCHSLEAANAYGSKPPGDLQGGERTNGPNFNSRKENRDDVLYAIRNGGFSGAIMPANIVVGEDAEAVADFLSKYSGGQRDSRELRDADAGTQ